MTFADIQHLAMTIRFRFTGGPAAAAVFVLPDQPLAPLATDCRRIRGWLSFLYRLTETKLNRLRTASAVGTPCLRGKNLLNQFATLTEAPLLTGIITFVERLPISTVTPAPIGGGPYYNQPHSRHSFSTGTTVGDMGWYSPDRSCSTGIQIAEPLRSCSDWKSGCTSMGNTLKT